MITVKGKDGTLLSIIYRWNDFINLREAREFITDNDTNLQVAAQKVFFKKSFNPHRHLTEENYNPAYPKQEVFIVLRGMMTLNVFDTDDTIVERYHLSAGDLAVYINGGHSIDISDEGCLFYEVKSGPYKGQETDKSFIDAKS